jgi:hypothetical protein
MTYRDDRSPRGRKEIMIEGGRGAEGEVGELAAAVLEESSN